MKQLWCWVVGHDWNYRDVGRSTGHKDFWDGVPVRCHRCRAGHRSLVDCTAVQQASHLIRAHFWAAEPYTPEPGCEYCPRMLSPAEVIE